MTEANFDNGYFDLLLGKVEEGESCHDLKEWGWMRKSALANKLGCRIIDLNIEASEGIVTDGAEAIAWDILCRRLDTFIDARKMRWSIKACLVAGGIENAGKGGGGGSFAVGASDQNRRELKLRVPERTSQNTHMVKVKLTGWSFTRAWCEFISAGV
jgi:hypothetical protein